MARSLSWCATGWLAVGLVGSIAASARAASLEDLERENRQLRAQLAALTSAHPTSPGMSHDEGAGADADMEGHSHDDGDHHDEIEFNYIVPFEEADRHDTIDGYPLMHLFKTEHAWLERQLHFTYAHSNGADGGHVKEDEFEMELNWALNSRFAVSLEAPITWRNPDSDPNTAGFGDMEVGFQFLAFQGEISILTFGLKVRTPTGDADRDLGDGHTTLIPQAILWHDFGGGWGLQADCGWETPVSVEEPEDKFVYDVAIYRVLPGAECYSVFRDLTTSLEANCETILNGPASGETVVNLTPGLIWIVRGHDMTGVAYSFPVTGDREFKGQFIYQYIIHF
jgi:hypothetical protein